MGVVSRQTRLNRLSSGNKCLGVPILEQIDVWMFLWDMFAGAAVQRDRHYNPSPQQAKNISGLGREGNVFPPEFQKAGFETEIRGVSNGKENASPGSSTGQKEQQH